MQSCVVTCVIAAIMGFELHGQISVSDYTQLSCVSL